MTATNAASTDSVATDVLGQSRLVRTTRPYLGSITTTLDYEPNGVRKKLTVTNGSWTSTLEYSHNGLSYPTQLPDFGGRYGIVYYNAAQQLDSLRIPTTVSSSTMLRLRPTGYTSTGRPYEVDLYAGTTRRDTWYYTHDAVGRVAEADSGDWHSQLQRTLSYDARGRLAGYVDTHVYLDSIQQSCDFMDECDGPPGWDYTWHYDTLRAATYNPDYSGNRTDGSASLSHDALATMTGTDGRAYTFSYDIEGRLQSKTATGYSQTYGWNDLGQLVWVKTNGDSVAYAYDAAGRRVQRYQSSSGARAHYIWDGDNLLMQLNDAGSRVYEYSYQPGVDRPYAVRVGGSTMYYYQLDELGNVLAVWNTSNGQAASYTYDPYGYQVASSGSLDQPLRWKGREYDSATGLYSMRARWYDPTVGRFLSEDPMGVAAGINPYTFGDGDPVNSSDPSGMDGDCPAGYTANPDSRDASKTWCVAPVDLSPMVITEQGPDGLPWGAQQIGVMAQIGAAAIGTNLTANVSAMSRLVARHVSLSCIESAMWENKTGLILDGLGWAATVALPEATAASAVAGSLIGVAGIGAAVLDHRTNTDAWTAGSLAYAGKLGAVGESGLSGAAKAVSHRLGVYALWASTTYDLGKTVYDYRKCASEH